MAKTSNGAKLPFMITCPTCAAEFELSQAILQHISGRLDTDLAAQLTRARQDERAIVEARFAEDAAAHDIEVTELRNKVHDVDKRALQLRQQERQLAERETAIKLEAEAEINRAKEEIRKSAEAIVTAKLQREIQQRDQLLETVQQRLATAEAAEAELRAGEAELIAREKNVQLELQRKLAEERPQIMQHAQDQLRQEHQLQLERRDLEVERLKAQIAKLQDTSASTGVPGEAAGESMECMVRDALRAAFPVDTIADVPKGIKGPDLRQTVVGPTQDQCGQIIWEVKNCKSWSEAWLGRAKENQLAADAELVVLVTKVLPSDLQGPFGLRAGVWVCSLPAAIAVGAVLRQTLLKLHALKSTAQARDARLKALYDYLQSTAFRLQVEAILSAVQALETQIQSEERLFTREWSRRKKHLLVLGQQLASMIGALEGSAQQELGAGQAVAEIGFAGTEQDSELIHVEA